MGRQETLWPLNTGLRSNRATGGKATNKVAAHCRSRVTASHVPGEPGHFLNASLTFSPACFRLPFTWSALPSPSIYGSSRALPVSFLTLPLAAWILFFALSAALTAVPSSRHSAEHACRPPPGQACCGASSPRLYVAPGMKRVRSGTQAGLTAHGAQLDHTARRG